jgi:hypothetical protein
MVVVGTHDGVEASVPAGIVVYECKASDAVEVDLREAEAVLFAGRVTIARLVSYGSLS